MAGAHVPHPYEPPNLAVPGLGPGTHVRGVRGNRFRAFQRPVRRRDMAVVHSTSPGHTLATPAPSWDDGAPRDQRRDHRPAPREGGGPTGHRGPGRPVEPLTSPAHGGGAGDPL